MHKKDGYIQIELDWIKDLKILVELLVFQQKSVEPFHREKEMHDCLTQIYNKYKEKKFTSKKVNLVYPDKELTTTIAKMVPLKKKLLKELL